MKKTKNILIGFLLIILLVPSVSFASWWNPFSWFEEKNKIEITSEISTSTPIIISEIKTESAWWNPFSWSKKEKQVTVTQRETASTTKEIILDQEDKEEAQDTEEGKTRLEVETVKVKAEAEKYRLQAEQARLEMDQYGNIVKTIKETGYRVSITRP